MPAPEQTRGSRRRQHISLLTDGEDDDGDVLGPLALLVEEVPGDRFLSLCHTTVVLPAVFLAEVVDLQHKDAVALFGHFQLAPGFPMGELTVEHRHGVGPHAGNERAVEGPGDGEVTVRNVLSLQDASELHRFTHRVQPLVRFQPNGELFV